MNDKDYDELENIIDRNTLNVVATKIAEICFEKANHIEETYGNGDANQWDDAGDTFENTAMEVSPL